MPQASTEHVSVAEAARELAASTDSIRRWFDLGCLDGFRTPGGQRRISRLSIDRLRGQVSEGHDPTTLQSPSEATS